jgi:hypothetical protein
MAYPNQGAGEAARPDASDRRDSVRIPIELQIRELALGGSFEQRSGNLGLGGVRFESLHPPVGDRFEVRFVLPGSHDELRAQAEVLRTAREGERFGIQLRFVDLPLEAELAIARCLQG